MSPFQTVFVEIVADTSRMVAAFKAAAYSLGFPERNAVNAKLRREYLAVDQMAVTYGDGFPADWGNR